MRYPPKYGLTQNWFMYKEDTSLLFLYTRNKRGTTHFPERSGKGGRAGWRYAVVGMAILAAAITPTVDPVNMGLVMLPLIGLYIISIVLAAIAGRGRNG